MLQELEYAGNMWEPMSAKEKGNCDFLFLRKVQNFETYELWEKNTFKYWVYIS